MSDIHKRLVDAQYDRDNFRYMESETRVSVGLAREAADEIERLRGACKSYEIQANRDALRLAEVEALLREWVACAINIGSGEATAKVEQKFVAQCRAFLSGERT